MALLRAAGCLHDQGGLPQAEGPAGEGQQADVALRRVAASFGGRGEDAAAEEGAVQEPGVAPVAGPGRADHPGRHVGEQSRGDRARSDRLHQQARGVQRHLTKPVLSQPLLAVARHQAEGFEEAGAEDSGEGVRLAGELRCRRPGRQLRRRPVGEGVDRVAQAVGIGRVGPQPADGRPHLLRQARDLGALVATAGRRDQRTPHRLQLQRREDGADVAEGLVEGSGLHARGVEELGLDRVQDGMSQLVAEDVRALTGVDRGPGHALVIEVEAEPVVVRIQVDAIVERYRQRAADPPFGRRRHDPGPEVRRASERLGRRPVAEGAGRHPVLGWRRRLPTPVDRQGQHRRREIRRRSLDRLQSGAGVILPGEHFREGVFHRSTPP